MDNRQDIDEILTQWPFDPMSVNVRQLSLDERDVLQMRVDMGLLQLETKGRPDGKRPHGSATYYDYLIKLASNTSGPFELTEDQCVEIDREFVQYYHRRVCWLQLREFHYAVKDADHTLQLMDFCKEFSPDEQWTISHEQYRPFVLYHRTQAAALHHIDVDDENGANKAIDEVNIGLERIRELFAEYQAEEQFEQDELVQRLIDFRDNLKERFEIGESLEEQLKNAIAVEDYETAAHLRDQMQKSVQKKDVEPESLEEDS